jgi:hypothetical protein
MLKKKNTFYVEKRTIIFLTDFFCSALTLITDLDTLFSSLNLTEEDIYEKRENKPSIFSKYVEVILYIILNKLTLNLVFSKLLLK